MSGSPGLIIYRLIKKSAVTIVMYYYWWWIEFLNMDVFWNQIWLYKSSWTLNYQYVSQYKILNHKNSQLCMIKKNKLIFWLCMRKISQSLTEVWCIWNNYQERLSERYFYFWKSHTDIFSCRRTNDREGHFIH